jgi:hypothetical protein
MREDSNLQSLSSKLSVSASCTTHPFGQREGIRTLNYLHFKWSVSTDCTTLWYSG